MEGQSLFFSLALIALLLHSKTAQSQQPPLVSPVSQPPPLLPSTPPSQPPSFSPLPNPIVSFSPTPLSLSPLSPSPAVPTINITAILDKPGRFSSLIRLLRTTQVDDRIGTLLSQSKQGLTLFAPTDAAFSALKPGTLNRLSVQQQVQVVLFHILISYYPISQFQSASNPLRTLAGDNGGSDYPLNVTTAGDDRVNLTSGLVNALVGKTIYTDGQLAVYQVDRVLLPPKIFAAAAPALAPSGSAHKKGDSDEGLGGSSGGAAVVENSGAVDLEWQKAVVLVGLGVLAAVALF